MPVQVYIPTSFRQATANAATVEVEASDVHALLETLEKRYDGFRGLVRDEAGKIRHHVNVYVNNEEIEALQGLATPLKDGDEVSIIPAMAGGIRSA